MNMITNLGPVMAIIAGLLILVVPRLLSTIVALYLIATGTLALMHANGYLQ